jgi:hypothetical protein
MTDMEVTPDPIVRTALQLLPIPPHTDDFWSRLDGALDVDRVANEHAPRDQRTVLVSGPTGADAPPPVELDGDPTLAIVPPALRRTSNAVLVAVAAAAIVVVALASSSLLEARNGTGVVAPDDPGQASAALETLVNDAQPKDATPDTISSDGAAASSEAVLAWVDDVEGGDGASAWQAMGPASQAHFGTQSAFEAQLISLEKDYGAWSGVTPDEVLVTPVAATDQGAIAVVTLVGTIDQGGTTRRRAVAFPVRIVDGEAVLEPFASAGALEVVVPEAAADAPPVDAGQELVLVVPTDAEAPVLRLDDGEAVVCGKAEGSELTALEGSDGQRCSYLPPAGIRPGEHTLTMAFLGADGTSISAGSQLFEAA